MPPACRLHKSYLGVGEQKAKARALRCGSVQCSAVQRSAANAVYHSILWLWFWPFPSLGLIVRPPANSTDLCRLPNLCVPRSPLYVTCQCLVFVPPLREKTSRARLSVAWQRLVIQT